MRLGVIDDLGFMYEFDTVVITSINHALRTIHRGRLRQSIFRVGGVGVTTRQRDTIPRCATHTKQKRRANGVKQKQRVKRYLDHTHNVIYE